MTDLVFLLAGLVLALAAGFLVQSLWSFRAQAPRDYAGTQPQLDIRQALQGPILCEGVIYGPTGRVTSRFVADMQGDWTGRSGVLRESFRYDNGNRQEREWRLTLGNDGSISGTAPDILGEATGRQSGATVCLKYRIRLPETAGGHVLDVIDWMYLAENGAIINRSQFRKFGIKVAELVATMRPRSDPQQIAAE
ncbi:MULTISPECIES: DUF3833 domain-containing protein [unclassified Meridianimarinicoccus]|uniref:DUF3833 domain-containing protein n=1 Tax=unclassified Meridianimarinicoccus TaxID=2923344 RepID=UPI001865C74C|nr:DUF3833 domain-containing protein [Fluviibacterium sp. MJW13]